MNKLNISVIGLGYVGLPLAIKLSNYFSVRGFDLDINKINNLKKKIDINQIVDAKELKKSKVFYTHEIYELKSSQVFIVTVPTPITKKNLPDLSNLRKATELLCKVIKKKDIIVYESTVYPGCTEEFCGQIIEKKTGLKSGKDFYLGYSPERINPGDKINTLEQIDKLVSSQNQKTSLLLKKIYNKIINKIHIVENIKIAEAAKVIENTQRDLNIALMNELSNIFNKNDIDTYKVIKAASTKWNFLKFTPGLVGGHCIGVDPYYLAYFAKKNGIHPKLILSGRKINEQMAHDVAKRALINFDKKKLNSGLKILIVGLTFKENSNDFRNSKVFNLIDILNKKKHKIFVYDPYLKEDLFLFKKRGIIIIKDLKREKIFYDLIMLMVPHKKIINKHKNVFDNLLLKNGKIFDLKDTLPYKENVIKI